MRSSECLSTRWVAVVIFSAYLQPSSWDMHLWRTIFFPVRPFKRFMKGSADRDLRKCFLGPGSDVVILSVVLSDSACIIFQFAVVWYACHDSYEVMEKSYHTDHHSGNPLVAKPCSLDPGVVPVEQ